MYSNDSNLGTRNWHTYTGTIIRLQDGALFGNQMGQAKIVHIAPPILY